MQQQLDAWIEKLRKEEDLSPATRRSYAHDIAHFAAWCATSLGADVTFAAIGRGDAADYRDAIAATKAPATVNRRLVALARFFADMGRAERNPFRDLGRVTEVEDAPEALEHGEWNRLRRAAEARSQRDRGLSLALISVGRWAGLRVGEIADLRGGDVQLGPRQGKIIVRLGKGRVYREVPAVAELREALAFYLDQRRQRINPKYTDTAWPDGFVFLGQRGRMSESGIRQLVAKLGDEAGLKACHPHQLRHTFAKSLLDPTAYNRDVPPASPQIVQRLMGHSDPRTTMKYGKATEEDLARAMGE